MHRTTAALAAAALTLLTACGSQTPGPAAGGDTSAGATGAQAASVCSEVDRPGRSPEAAEGVALPADFVVTGVVSCGTDQRPVAGDGVWNYMVERRATSSFDALVAALRRPDEARGTGSCLAILYVVPWIAVVDASGRSIHARIPRDDCGQPQGEARSAVEALVLTEVSATRRDQVKTEAQSALESKASAAGCVTPFKDMVAITDGDRAPLRSAPDPLLRMPSGVLHVCRFTAGTDRDGTPMLSFDTGETLSAAASAAVIGALAESGPAQPCTQAHSGVTALFTEQNGWALVETDGCRRVESGESGGWRQATPELLVLLG